MNTPQIGIPASHVVAAGLRARDSRVGEKASAVSFRQVAILYIPIALLLAPFADHSSKDPVFLTYSWHYLLFLGMIAVAGAALAFGLVWMVRRAPAHRRFLYNIVLLGVVVCILIGAEVTLGFMERDVFAPARKWGQCLNQFTGFENEPNHRWTMAGATYSTDADTFRTHPTARTSAEKETLIVVMGGSSAFGFGLNDDETLSQLLEVKLRARFGDTTTVLNAANNGHNTLQQLFRFYNRVLPLKPDLVIYYGAIADVRPNRVLSELTHLVRAFPKAATTRAYQRQVNRGRGFYFENSLLIGHIIPIFEYVYHRVAGDGYAAYTKRFWNLSDEDFAETATMFIRNLDTLRLLCEGNDIEFLPVTFIAVSQDMPEALNVGLPYFVERLRSYCRERGFPLCDLHPAFSRVEDKSRLFFRDQYHPTREGAEFIADQLTETMIPMIRSLATHEG